MKDSMYHTHYTEKLCEAEDVLDGVVAELESHQEKFDFGCFGLTQCDVRFAGGVDIEPRERVLFL